MPFPNEHAARILPPDQFTDFRRENNKFGQGIDVIWGIDGHGGANLQAIRFRIAHFKEEDARAWLSQHRYHPILFEPATKDAANVVLASSGMSNGSFLSDGTASGAPSKLFRKELIRVGTFVKSSDNIEFQVTHDTLIHWVDTFDSMVKNGIQIPLPTSHFEADDPTKNRGYLRSLQVSDSSLFGILELIGEDGIGLADRSDVSVFSPAEWVDGVGNVYHRPILHVALTPFPVIPGLQGFEALAASLLIRKELIPMNWKKIAEKLGIPEGKVNDGNGIDLVLSFMDKSDTEHAAAIKETEAKVAKAETELKTLSLSHAGDYKPDPLVVKFACENREMKLNSLVAAGRITPVVRKSLGAIFEDQEALTLSLGRGFEDHFDEIYTALTENDPAVLKESTGKQTVALSQIKSDGKKSELVENAKARREAVAKAGSPA